MGDAGSRSRARAMILARLASANLDGLTNCIMRLVVLALLAALAAASQHVRQGNANRDVSKRLVVGVVDDVERDIYLVAALFGIDRESFHGRHTLS
jgi:preprotein translocase subunit SecF